MAVPGPHVVGVSYLATARLLRIHEHPQVNYGAEVVQVDDALAADAPMVGAALGSFGVSVLLCTKEIGLDPAGGAIVRLAARHSMHLAKPPRPHLRTPEIIVLSADDGNRTWYAHLPDVEESIRSTLATVDLGNPLLMYVDCYGVLELAAIEAVMTAKRRHIPLYLNLGGGTLSPGLCDAVQAAEVVCIQTNLDESEHRESVFLAEMLSKSADAEIGVVTVGARGAVAVFGGSGYNSAAYAVDLQHAHGAGAAFSGGFIYGLLHHWTIQEMLDLGCACGSLRCELPQSSPWPSLDKVDAFARSHKRLHS